MKATRLFLTILTPMLLCAATAAQGQQRSLYSDIKAHQVGDVITVILTENISGSSNSDASAQSNTAGSASSSVSSNFVPFEPMFGADVTVDYNSDERITAQQQQLLQGTVSVRIERVEDNGDLFISGTRSTEINGELHSMEVNGFVRPSDVSDANQVLSYRIANANIKYLKKGGIRETRNKLGIGRKIIWGVLGAVTGAAIIMSQN